MLFIHYGLLQMHVHTFRVKMLTVRQPEQRLQHVATDLCRAGLSRYAKAVAAADDIHIEAAFDLPQVFVELPAQVGQALIIGGLEDYVPRNLGSIQGRCL